MDELIEKLLLALEKPLPGWDAQRQMINYDRPRPESIEAIDPDARKSAVLALIYPIDGIPNILLTLRHVYKGTHSGQVSFPGGSVEAQDLSLWHTALREAEEETGVDPAKVQLISPLTQVYIPPSRFLVSPFLAYAEEKPALIGDPFEVQAILEIPISQFLESHQPMETMMELSGFRQPVKIKYFDVAGQVVWGATAMIISEILALIKS